MSVDLTVFSEIHFIRGFSEAAIEGYLDEVEDVLAHINQLPPLTFQQALGVLNKINLGVSQEKGLRIGGLKEIQVLFSLHALKSQAAENLVTAKMCRRKILACNHHLDTQLQTSIYQRAQVISRQRSAGHVPVLPNNHPDVLLHRLVRVVQDDLERHLVEYAYHSSELLDTLFSPPMPVIYPPRSIRISDGRYYVGEGLHLRTADIVVQIIRSWFELPGDRITRTRTKFLGVVLYTLGYAAYLLPCVWDLYDSCPFWLTKGKTSPISA